MADPESIYRAEDEVLENQIRIADEERERIQQENDMLEYYLQKTRQCRDLVLVPTVAACCAGPLVTTLFPQACRRRQSRVAASS